MLKRALVGIVLVATMMVNTGCYGSFTLTNKIYKWNGKVGDKYLNSVVFWVLCILQVYPVCGFIDAVVLNVIEFWMGNNPLALNSDVESHKQVVSGDKVYDVTVGKGTISIVETKGPDAGKKISLNFEASTGSWALIDASGNKQMIAAINTGKTSTVSLVYPDGKIESKSLFSIN